MERCEVVLRLAKDFVGSSLGLAIGDAQWVLEAQVATPAGIIVVASCQYSSDNDLAEYQGSKKGFQQARRRIIEVLSQDGWEQLPSAAGGPGMLLPCFQRRAGVEKERLVQAVRGSGLGGLIVTRVFQSTAKRSVDVLIDGTKVANIGAGETARLDLAPGNYDLQFTSWPLKSEVFRITAEPDVYPELCCGVVVGLMTGKIVVRGRDGRRMSASDNGKSFAD